MSANAIDLDSLTIHSGKHESPDEGHCIMEVVAMLANEPWSDSPACVCPVVASFARRLNDAYGSDDEGRTAAFRPLVRALMGTRGSRKLMQRRMFAAADGAVRVFTPLALDARKMPELAATLRAVPEIVDRASAVRARDITREVRALAAHDASAAYAAYAYAAYAYAAYAAAYAAYAADAYAAYAAYAADAADAYAADAADAADGSLKIQARRDALAHGITLLVKLCEMRDPS